ncbi:MAG TPA: globin domain-containing protein [Microvirga sp.]|jgi:nitric oxide dioxygenase|nr:globin domain-containing protein [Microvirga sp.]
MNPADIASIQSSFRRLAAAPEALAADFYACLFHLDPTLRPLFKDDLRRQGRKLTAALAHVVHGLGQLDAILEDVRALARRHADYGVEPSHYGTVGQALLTTLEARLGRDFTPELRAAWTEAYALLAGAMIAASSPARAAA